MIIFSKHFLCSHTYTSSSFAGVYWRKLWSGGKGTWMRAAAVNAWCAERLAKGQSPPDPGTIRGPRPLTMGGVGLSKIWCWPYLPNFICLNCDILRAGTCWLFHFKVPCTTTAAAAAVTQQQQQQLPHSPKPLEYSLYPLGALEEEIHTPTLMGAE